MTLRTLKAALCGGLAACLLAGCAGLNMTPTPPAATPAPTAANTPDGGVLRLWMDEGAEGLSPAFDAYAAARGVTIREADSPQAADLAILTAPPAGETGWMDPAELTLLPDLMAAQSLSAYNRAVPLGGAAWGYWAERSALEALVPGLDPEDLRQASWSEWTKFVQAVQDWTTDPDDTAVTLNGTRYALAAERGPALEGLTGVFAPAGSEGDVALWTPAATAAGSGTPEGSSLYAVLELEAENAAPGQSVGAVLGGTALLARAGSVQAAQMSAPVLLPCKQPELTPENGCTLTAQQLLAWPAAGTGAWAALPDAADDAQG
ncbi:MAG: hypothetical protein IJ484_01355, partial [Oscillospiraceae bacterium]|nr:hypothetical protein [Oscillospiraceae bacterium]